MKLQESAVAVKVWKRLDGVDLVRGVAILFVLLNHVNMQLLFAHVPYTQGLPKQLVSSLVWNGQYGVQMFFVVSGFLITSTSIRRWGSLQDVRLREFYLLRVARIAPLFLLLLALLSVLHLAHVKHFLVSAKDGGLGNALFAALTFRINVLEATRGYLPGNWDILWSLSVEEMFYLFFPVVCFLLGRRRLLIPLLIGFVILGPFGRTLLAGGNEVWHEYSYLGAMDAIALGCLTAMLTSRTALRRRALGLSGAVGAVLVLLILCFSRQAAVRGLERSGLDMSVLAFGTCLLIVAAAEARWTAPRILWPVRWLGQRSYEIYLSHMFVVLGVFGIYLALGKPLVLPPVLFVVVILLAGLLGEIVARFYSEPMNGRLRSRFAGKASRLGSVSDGAPAPSLTETAR